MSPDDAVRVRHMMDFINSALAFAWDRTRADLDTDQMLTFALVRAVEVVGEAATRLSPEERAEIPDRRIAHASGRFAHPGQKGAIILACHGSFQNPTPT